VRKMTVENEITGGDITREIPEKNNTLRIVI
jgi:hypothetical protein